MTRHEFEHAIRAAGAVLGVNELIVIGSQALHGSLEDDLPEEAVRSVEVDVAFAGDPDGRMADLLDGSIGEASMFHETFGYYAQGVTERTATLPDGWRDRLVTFETEATNGVRAMCLDVHDPWIAKSIASRPKDVDFCGALVARRLVNATTLAERLAAVKGVDARIRSTVAERIRALRT
ncbi:MAG: hypothetical protein FJ207_08805 [Gemmatimonadetes bacterium]|nr:hypothetical protein [Gemmatimonadota bacterium]